MLNRVSVALALALLGFLGTTSAAAAASDTEKVMVGTFLVVLAMMALLFGAYLIKRTLGLVRAPPPEPEGEHGAHH
jgi:uncharacterized membrane protein